MPINKKHRSSIRMNGVLVGEGGFEPPKLKAADLQSAPFGHSGTLPYAFFHASDIIAQQNRDVKQFFKQFYAFL